MATLTGTCIVPRCGKDGRLYPGGWLCDGHKPVPAPRYPKLTVVR